MIVPVIRTIAGLREGFDQSTSAITTTGQTTYTSFLSDLEDLFAKVSCSPYVCSFGRPWSSCWRHSKSLSKIPPPYVQQSLPNNSSCEHSLVSVSAETAHARVTFPVNASRPNLYLMDWVTGHSYIPYGYFLQLNENLFIQLMYFILFRYFN